ncbi:MAG TPA: alpha/beta hydrolase [Parvibaculum sp.]|uniref:esterase/lipase family protein n=1 Tax=Parvibaculum sp. TaxID=2024848 RepID=UPI002C145C47|nr:alpha/beta fold hydrolase [Parvibaculum sp.]HMM14779.1 alpha/beta hydrolase [Parvibaculum sp.]
MAFETGFDLLRLQGDVLWASGEFAAKIFTEPYLKLIARKGDGNTPVMTLPGFTGPEFSLQPLNQFLRANGYVAQSWGLGTNRGIRDMEHMEEIAASLGDRIRSIADEHGRAVSLVGQSLGGVFARELARRFPDEVDRVITLGSPAHFGEAPKHVNAMVARVMTYYTGRTVDEHLREVRDRNFNISEPPPGVPLVSIYSLYDGIAPAPTTRIPNRFLNVKGDVPRENIEIVCSHCGMGVNPLVLLAVADRLAEDREEWIPFDPSQYAAGPAKHASRWFYPSRLYPKTERGLRA